MRKLALLLCLALAAGLLVSCGRTADADPGKAQNGANIDVSRDLGVATDDQSQQKSDGSDLSNVDVEALLAGSRISGSFGGYTFSFSHPQVPDGLHLTVSLKVFQQSEEGDRLLFSFDSDGSWLADPQDYDPSARNVSIPVDIKENLCDMYVFVSAKLVDADGETSYAAAVRDPEGCMSEGYDGIFAWSGAQ